MKKRNWMLKSHELCVILGWKIKKVFHRLRDGKIPAERIRRKRRTEFFVSPAALKAWINSNQFSVSIASGAMLEERSARERDHVARACHRQMAKTSQRVESRFANLNRLRAQQQRQFAELRRVDRLLTRGQQRLREPRRGIAAPDAAVPIGARSVGLVL
jgi:hypothetical protein